MANNRELSQFGSFVEVSNSTVGITTSVGIAKTNPQYALDVEGDINFSGTFFQGGSQFIASRWTATGSDIYRLSGVGINTSLVSSTLTVSGDVNVSGVVTATSFSGSLSGTATSTTNIPNLSGDVSSNNTVTTLATVNSNVGNYGDANFIPSITVNGKGLVTGVSSVAVNNGSLSLGVSGTGLSGSASFSANQSGNSSFTVTSNATSANTGGTIVARDSGGNFYAGIITASLSGNASSATALQSARTFEITGDIVGSPVSFDGTGNVSIAATIQPNSVALGDDTTGNYVATISGTAGEVEVSGSGSESAAVTIGLPDVINVGGVNVSGISTFQDNVYLGDNDKVNFGNSNDLEIYHDGTHSWIWEQGPGNLYLRSNGGSINLRLNSTDMVVVNEGGSVDLYHNTSKKIETTSTGITVTGTAVATTFSGSGASLTSIPNSALDNSSVSFGGVSVSLGSADATPAFDLQDATGLPISTGVSGLGANVATFLATPSSSNLAAAVTDETGSGALVFATSPTLVTPTLGAASATSVTASGTITANTYNVGTDAGISTTRTTVATTTATAIETIAVATYRSARMQVQITQGTDYQTSDILMIHNGTSSNIVEYGSIATNDYLCTFSTDVSGGNARLLVTMTSATSATVKVLTQKITV